MKIIIAGSGPAGVFAATGALGPEVEILMIDPGLELPDGPKARVAELAALPPERWCEPDLAFIKGAMHTTPSGIAEKTLYGSDFASRSLPCFPTRFENAHVYISYARGGLSNIWGRGVEPIPRADRAAWPFIDDLEQSYREVLEALPFVAADDNLAEVLPLYTTRFRTPPLSSQFETLHRRLRKHERPLNAQGIHFGQSRFLIEFAQDDAHTCRFCNLCMYGCAYGAMYSTHQTLAALEQSPNFEYRGGLALESFVDEGQRVTLQVIDVASGERSELVADKLVIAAGAVNTTRIAMLALGATEASLKTSDMIQIPLLALRGRREILDERTYSLAQLTLAIRDPAVARQAIIVHLFGFNPIFLDAVRSLLPRWAYRLLEIPIHGLLARVFIASSLVGSQQSARLALKLRDDTLEIRGHAHPDAKRVARRLAWKLAKSALRTGLLPLPFLTSRKPPGGSVHCGASLPVGGPGPLSTRADGALSNCPNVYIADSSALPDVPAGSFTLTLMANAHRVGRGLRRTARGPGASLPTAHP
jgi:choline dehydrogenase-like flavoprotein